mgnify:CR=1 FL=1
MKKYWIINFLKMNCQKLELEKQEDLCCLTYTKKVKRIKKKK